jgi:hypothetical protein
VLLRFASIVTGDNAITFFNLGLLTFALAAVEKTMIFAGFCTFVLVSLVCASWLRKGAVSRESDDASHKVTG